MEQPQKPLSIEQEARNEYLRWLRSRPIISAEREKYCLQHKDNPECRQELIIGMTRAVLKICSPFEFCTPLGIQDLVHTGLLGLDNAIKLWDPKKNDGRLIGFARWHIRKYLDTAIGKAMHGSTISVSNFFNDKLKKYLKMKSKGLDPSKTFSESDLNQLELLSMKAVSLDVLTDEDWDEDGNFYPPEKDNS